MTHTLTVKSGTKHWDGTQALAYRFTDGGRAAAGFKGAAGDCVARGLPADRLVVSVVR